MGTLGFNTNLPMNDCVTASQAQSLLYVLTILYFKCSNIKLAHPLSQLDKGNATFLMLLFKSRFPDDQSSCMGTRTMRYSMPMIADFGPLHIARGSDSESSFNHSILSFVERIVAKRQGKLHLLVLDRFCDQQSTTVEIPRYCHVTITASPFHRANILINPK
jgi:hypothetical protein